MALNLGNSATKYPRYPEPPKLASSKKIGAGNTECLCPRLSRFTNQCSLLDGGIATNRLKRSGRDTETMAKQA